MLSQSQIDANRLNSKKSSGPTSPAGKAASSLNALTSAIHAASHIVRGEDPTELEALTAAFLLHHQPAGPKRLFSKETKTTCPQIGFVLPFASAPGERPP